MVLKRARLYETTEEERYAHQRHVPNHRHVLVRRILIERFEKQLRRPRLQLPVNDDIAREKRTDGRARPTHSLGASQEERQRHLKPQISAPEQKHPTQRENVHIIALFKHRTHGDVLLRHSTEGIIQSEHRERQRRGDERDLHPKRRLVTHPQHRRADEVPHPLKTILQSGDRAHELKQRLLLILRRHELRHRLPSQLRQVLRDAADRLRHGDERDRLALRPPVVPREQHPQPHHLQSQPRAQRLSHPKSRARDAGAQIRRRAAQFVQRKHRRHLHRLEPSRVRVHEHQHPHRAVRHREQNVRDGYHRERTQERFLRLARRSSVVHRARARRRCGVRSAVRHRPRNVLARPAIARFRRARAREITARAPARRATRASSARPARFRRASRGEEYSRRTS